jgi:hypothetical protein
MSKVVTVHHGKSGENTNGVIGADEVKTFLAQLTAAAGPALALTAKDRKRATKLRKGGEKFIPTILALSEQFGINVASHPLTTIAANVDKVKNLTGVHKQLVTATKQVDDAIFQAQSDGWDGASVHYAVLKRLAKSNGDIATALAPATEFFAKKSAAVVKAEDAKRGHRKGAKAKSASATPAANETNGAPAPEAPTPTVTAAPPPAPVAPAVAPNGVAHS